MVNDMDIYYAHTLREVEHYGDYEVVKAKEAQAEIDAIKLAVINCFGKYPTSCDGVISVPVGNYYKLLETLDKGK
jgi:hypothetical protein